MIKSWIKYLIYNINIRVAEGPVKFKWVNDLNLYVEKADSCLGGNVFLGLMEFNESAFLVHYLKQSELFADVGANLGHYSLLASGISGAKTIAIEPIPKTCLKLKYNIKKNGVGRLVTIINIGVGNKEKRKFFTNLNENAINYVLNKPSERSLIIPIKKLNNIFMNRPPKIMKIDVEGYELIALKGANKILMDDDCQVLIVEINGHCSRYGSTMKDVFNYIKGYGFIPVTYDAFKRKIIKINSINQDSDNTIFIKDIKAAEKRVTNGKEILFDNHYKI